LSTNSTSTDSPRPRAVFGARSPARNPFTGSPQAVTGLAAGAAAFDAELIALRAEIAHLRRVNQKLLDTVTELRVTVERQQAHIDKLVRMSFGRKSERVVAGPTLFDDVPGTDPASPAPRASVLEGLEP
jgi:uncharacterized coiled-coil protein SlyX